MEYKIIDLSPQNVIEATEWKPINAGMVIQDCIHKEIREYDSSGNLISYQKYHG